MSDTGAISYVRVKCPKCGAHYHVDIQPDVMDLGVVCDKCQTLFAVREHLLPPKKQQNNNEQKSKLNINVKNRTLVLRPASLRNNPNNPAVSNHLSAGDLLMGRYEIAEELGRGGICSVYKCSDKNCSCTVALKVLPLELSHNTLETDEIKERIQLVRNLHHPNILSTVNLEQDPSRDLYYIVSEYAEGENLRDWSKRKREEGNLSIETILHIFRQIASALDYAHEKKIIHRDLNPGNIIVDNTGNVKILDFGIATQIHAAMNRIGALYRGHSWASPYMAPEQWTGCAQGAQTDQYALAVMVYEILAGYLPFECTDAKILREAVLNAKVSHIQNIPLYVNIALDTAMNKDPEHRFVSCTLFAEAINGEMKQINTQSQVSVLKQDGNYSAKPQSRKNNNDVSNQSDVPFLKKPVYINIKFSYIIALITVIILFIFFRKEINSLFYQHLTKNYIKTETKTAASLPISSQIEEEEEEDNDEDDDNDEKSPIKLDNESPQNKKDIPVKTTMSGEQHYNENTENDNGLIFYAPLSNHDKIITDGTLTKIYGNLLFTKQDNIPCAFFDGKTFLSFDTLHIPRRPCTISLWIKCAKLSQNETNIFSSGKDIYLSRNQGKLTVRCGGSNGHICKSSSFDIFQWNHILYKISNKSQQVYVNGILCDEFPITESEEISGIGYIGTCRFYPQKNIFTGYMAALRVYNRTLDAKEIKALAHEFNISYKETTHKPLTLFLPGTVKLEMMKVETGTFLMSEGTPDEHTVKLTQDFYIGKYEVTQGQWNTLMNHNPSSRKGLNLPVERVTWHEAMEFCEKLNTRGYVPKGWLFTLPTDAQWEYAAKGGRYSRGYTYSGSDKIGSVAWYRWNSKGQTHPVGFKKANELGIYDMSGNVWEWCLDDYNIDSRNSVPEFYRARDNSNANRTYRGAGWRHDAIWCRPTARIGLAPGSRNISLGFRLALVPKEQKKKKITYEPVRKKESVTRKRIAIPVIRRHSPLKTTNTGYKVKKSKPQTTPHNLTSNTSNSEYTLVSSSIYRNQYAYCAMNGKYEEDQTFHSQKEYEPWWMIKFNKGPVYLNELRIRNRSMNGKGPVVFLTNLDLQASTNGHQWVFLKKISLETREKLLTIVYINAKHAYSYYRIIAKRRKSYLILGEIEFQYCKTL